MDWRRQYDMPSRTIHTSEHFIFKRPYFQAGRTVFTIIALGALLSAPASRAANAITSYVLCTFRQIAQRAFYPSRAAARLLVVLTAVALGYPDCAHAVVRRHDVATAFYIDFAKEDVFDPVGFLSIPTGKTETILPNGETETTIHYQVGTSTLIAPNWVLTAAHVVEGYDSTLMTKYGEFGLGASRASLDTYGIDNSCGSSGSQACIFIHPGYAGEDSAPVNDIALIKLTDLPSVEPAFRYRGSSELGHRYVFAGYGNRGTGLSGEDESESGVKLAGANVFDKIGDVTVRYPNPLFPLQELSYTLGSEPDHVLWSDFDDPDGGSDFFSFLGLESANIQDFEAAYGEGDSGGGNFIEVEGRYQLAGVTSATTVLGLPSFLDHIFGNWDDTTIDSDYGDQSHTVRVSSFNSWIDGILGANYFNNPNGGVFGELYNWSSGEAPTAMHDVVFNSPTFYDVDIEDDIQSDDLRVEAGGVNLNLGGNNYAVADDLHVGEPRSAILALTGPGAVNVNDDVVIHPLGTLSLGDTTLTADALVLDGRLRSAGGRVNLNTLSGSGEVNLSNGELAIDLATPSTFSGRFTGDEFARLNGELRLNGASSHTGKIFVADQGILILQNSQTFTSSSRISGSGEVRFQDGTHTLASAITLPA